MYFIVTKKLAVFQASMIDGTIKDEAVKGELTAIDVEKMRYLNHQGEWKSVEHWEHPFDESDDESTTEWESISIDTFLSL